MKNGISLELLCEKPFQLLTAFLSLQKWKTGRYFSLLTAVSTSKLKCNDCTTHKNEINGNKIGENMHDDAMLCYMSMSTYKFAYAIDKFLFSILVRSSSSLLTFWNFLIGKNTHKPAHDSMHELLEIYF